MLALSLTICVNFDTDTPMIRLKNSAFLVLAITLFTACSPKAPTAQKHSDAPVDLPPDATTEQIKAKLDQEEAKKADDGDARKSTPEEEELYAVSFKIGSRLNLWIKNINSNRPADNQLSLWSPETTRATPIDAPKDRTNYGVSSAKTKMNALKARAPEEMVGVLFGEDTVPSDFKIKEDDFLEWGREFDRAYQTGMRLKMLLPYRDWYKENRRNDVRGYYFLSKLNDRQRKLANFSNLPSSEQEKILPWLIEICMNGDETIEDCKSTLRTQIASGFDLNPFYNNYIGDAEKTWKDFFNIKPENARSDIYWTKENPNLATIPFLKTSIQEVNDYLSVNIQGEWKFGKWQLELSFKDEGSNIPYVVFEAGATPHVSGLGGNKITMDALTNLQGWDSRWTIRHEFGHVLGFPDCYVEFYEEESDEMVNYQLDVEDLMCSRRGKMKERLFSEMKRTYGPKTGR